MMTQSNDGGSMVAIADVKGYITIYDCETKAEKIYFANLEKEIIAMEFSADNQEVIALSRDRNIAVSNFANKDSAKKLFGPSGTQVTNDLCLFTDAAGTPHIVVGGYDCALR